MNCKHDGGWLREEIGGHTYARCKKCGVVHRVISSDDWPADWSKEGDQDN